MLQTSVQAAAPLANSKTNKHSTQAKGQPAAAPSLACVLDDEWLVEHARQVSASLPGGETSSDSMIAWSDTPSVGHQRRLRQCCPSLRIQRCQQFTALHAAHPVMARA